MIAAVETKRCTKCSEEKPLSEFYAYGSRRPGEYRTQCKECCRAGDRGYHEQHKSERSEQRKLYRAANPEKFRDRRRQYHEDNREAENARNKAYNDAHKAEAAARIAERRKDPDVVSAQRARCLDHYYRNKPMYTDAVARRRAQRLGNGVEKYSRLDIYDRDEGQCHLCGEFVEWKDFSIDHLIPISKGGPDTPANVATSHLSCNKSRGTKPIANRGGR